MFKTEFNLRSMSRKGSLRFALCFALLSLLSTFCEITEFKKDPLHMSVFKTNAMTELKNEAGLLKTAFYTYETVLLSIRDLYPDTQTDIQVIRLLAPGNTQWTIRRSLVLSDAYGQINNLPVWYFIGTNEEGRTRNDYGDYVIHILQPKKNLPWVNISIPFKVKPGLPPYPQIRAVNSRGIFTGGSLPAGSALYVNGSGFVKGTPVQLRVVRDQKIYMEGDPLMDVTGSVESAVAGEDGTLDNQRIWDAADQYGLYDLVADVAPFGVYTKDDVVASGQLPGICVQTPPIGDHLFTNIACDAFGNPVDVVQSNEDLYAMLDPGVRSTIKRTYSPYDQLDWTSIHLLAIGNVADIYVCLHKEHWVDGDTIFAAIPTVGGHEMPIRHAINPFSTAMSLIRVRGACSPEEEHPIRLWPGAYDIVIDMDLNGHYDRGVDYLQGGRQPAFIVPGETPPLRFVTSARSDFLDRYSSKTTIRTVLLRRNGEPIRQNPVRFQVISGPGHLHNTIDFTDTFGFADGYFSGAVWGRPTVVQAHTIVNDTTLTNRITIYRKVPYTHTQGVLSGG